MNNLHRELAPTSAAAWAQIEEEATRTLKRYLAGRRVVDVPSPGGVAVPGVATGHLLTIAPPAEGVVGSQREVKAFVELRVPFELSRRLVRGICGSLIRSNGAGKLGSRSLPNPLPDGRDFGSYS